LLIAAQRFAGRKRNRCEPTIHGPTMEESSREGGELRRVLPVRGAGSRSWSRFTPSDDSSRGCHSRQQQEVGTSKMTRPASRENRRSLRVPVPRGVWVAWQAEGARKQERHVSRVGDLSAGGVFISTTLPLAVGTKLAMLFAIPEGETRILGIVRFGDTDKGVGVEFTKMTPGDRARLQQLLRRLNR
jgi:PilZ domain